MKASKFAEFFDFNIVRNYGCNELDGLYRFEVIDNNGTLPTRRILSVGDLTHCFGSLIEDYIFSNLEYHGFDYAQKGRDYPAALDFAKKKSVFKDSDTKEVIECMIDPNLIEDDISDYEVIRHNARALLVEWFASLWTSHAFELIFDLQSATKMTIDKIIDTIVKGCEADGEYSENDAELSIGAMESICELEATLFQQTNYREQTIEVITHMVNEAQKYAAA